MSEALGNCTLCYGGVLQSIDPSIALCECQACAFIFRNPRPTFDEIAEHYSRGAQYESWLAAEKARDAMWRRRLRKITRHRKGGSLLDVGAGIGQFLHVAQNNFKVEGTEISKSALRIGADKYGLALHNGSLEEIVDTALRERRFDIITLFHVLEHVPWPAATLAACTQLLVEGGLLVVAVPNDIGCWKRPLKDLLRFLGIRRFRSRGMFGLSKLELRELGSEIHLSHFTASVLQATLRRQGFQIQELGIDPFYVEVGARAAVHALLYVVCSMFRWISGVNIYDTIWVVAEKTTAT
jgi:2-polyprenyl-3-methyl-5-hydroxy-6-metoxy-1,4-benzoquinol methylase